MFARVSARLLGSILLGVAPSLLMPHIECRAAELYVAGSTVSITPDRPVALSGQMHTRIARYGRKPGDGHGSGSGIEGWRQGSRSGRPDLVRPGGDRGRRARSGSAAGQGADPPDWMCRKLVINATHTHTAPVMRKVITRSPRDDVMQPAEYVGVPLGQGRRSGREGLEVAQAGPGGLGAWACRGGPEPAIGLCRRPNAEMYGPTDRPEFRGIEGSEDQGVEVLFFWDRDGKLIATAVNVACPSQEVEGRLGRER